jgi:hypothetical protein
MLPPKDPFSGLNLSAQTNTQPLDQRLFAPAPTTEPKLPDRSTPRASVSARPNVSRLDASTSEPIPAPDHQFQEKPRPSAASRSAKRIEISSFAASRFDLADEALYQASFVFTQEELEALEDLKIELKRELDTKVTKNDLIRSALHMLVEDYRTNGERADVYRRLCAKLR